MLDEIGINLAADLADAPTAAIGQPVAPVAVAAAQPAGGGGNNNNDMDDLAARLNNLRK